MPSLRPFYHQLSLNIDIYPDFEYRFLTIIDNKDGLRLGTIRSIFIY